MEGVRRRPSIQVLFAHPCRPSPAPSRGRKLDPVVGGRQRNPRIGLGLGQGDMMRWLQGLSLKLRAALRRTRVEQEMEAELAEHLECETKELIALGVAPAEARRRAAATMGRMDSIKEGCRDGRGTAG